MRLSIDTLLLLAQLGDHSAKHTVLWLHGLEKDPTTIIPGRTRFDAEAWTGNEGRIGAGWPGISNARRWPVNLHCYQADLKANRELDRGD